MKNEGLLMAFFIHWYLFLINNLQPPYFINLAAVLLILFLLKGCLPHILIHNKMKWKDELKYGLVSSY